MNKILVYIPSVAMTVGGGVATQAETTTLEAQKLGIPIERFCSWKKYNWNEVSAIHIYRADYESINLAKLAKEKNIPLIVTPVFYSQHNASRIKLLLKGVEFLNNFLSGISTDLNFTKEICQLADLVVPNTKDEAKLISRAFNINYRKIKIVHNGVSLQFLEGDPSLFIDKYNLKDFVLTVANIGYKRKNILNAVKAMSKSSLDYVIIGPTFNNSYSNEVLEIINCHKNIHYIGEIDNKDPLLISAYSAASLFLLPSLFETPGISAMEAALAGCEIVITPIGGTKDYFGDFATYINPKSVNSILKNVEKAYYEQPKNPKSVIVDKYLWSNIGKEIEKVYKEFI